MSEDAIWIENARAHNLKGVSCRIPVGQMTVVSGVSGSGKSSTYARQFLERLPRPAVDRISNLPPAIAIEQHNRVSNARSTVGTATEILDHLRLLFARIGETRCCGKPVRPGTVEGVTGRLLEQHAGERVTLLAPLPRRRGETPKALRERLVREGYTRLFSADGEILDVTELTLKALRAATGSAELVIDRVAVGPEARARIAEAVAAAFEREGEVRIATPEGERRRYRAGFACEECGRRHPTPEPALFSFNSPLGACELCHGFGRTQALDLERVVPDPKRSLAGGAIAPFQTPSGRGCQRDLMRAAGAARFPTRVPWGELDAEQRAWVVEGDDDWYGVRGYFEYLESRRYKVQARVTIARYRRFDPCESCGGSRLRPEALCVVVGGRSLGEIASLSIAELEHWLAGLTLGPPELARGGRLLDGLRARVGTAREVGLGYLSLERQVRTLSGGEAQRIQLATALGGALTGTLYVLDEPSVGLHARDVERLLRGAFGGPPRARRRASAARAACHPGPGQHGRRGGARGRDRAGGGSRHRPRAWRRSARGGGGRRRQRGRARAQLRVSDGEAAGRPLSGRADAATQGARGSAGPRRGGAQPEGCGCRHPAWPARRREWGVWGRQDQSGPIRPRGAAAPGSRARRVPGDRGGRADR
jgi:excinuclease ABC subunit A